MHVSSIAHPIRYVGFRSRVSIVGTLAILLISPVMGFPESHAESTSNSGIYVAAGGGAALYTPTGAAGSKSHFGFVGRGDVGYRFGDVRVAAQGSYASFALESSTVGATKIESRTSIVAIMATGWYDIPAGATIVPYVGGGLGLVIRTATAVVADDALSASETHLGAQAGLGVNVRLSGALDLQLGYRIMAPFGDPSLQLFHHAEIGVLYRL